MLKNGLYSNVMTVCLISYLITILISMPPKAVKQIKQLKLISIIMIFLYLYQSIRFQ